MINVRDVHGYDVIVQWPAVNGRIVYSECEMAFFRDMEEDPFFSGFGFPHMRSGFPSMFPSMMLQPAIAPSRQSSQLASRPVMADPFQMMLPFGGHSMFSQMAAGPNSHSFSQTTVMSYSSHGPGGKPHVYQATSSTKRAPGNIQETRKAVRDSHSCVQKTSVSHHIGGRSHTIERQYNGRTQEGEEHHHFENMDESDASHFNDEWIGKTSSYMLEGHHRHGNQPHPIMGTPRYPSETHSAAANVGIHRHQREHKTSRPYPAPGHKSNVRFRDC